MIPAVPPVIKVMTIVLAGSIVLAPVSKVESVQEVGAANKITQRIINEIHEKKKLQENPNYKPKKKLPITGGFKSGYDPLPKGTTPARVRSKIWESIKGDLGLK